ncbi:MAG: VOC family protein [Chromatiales bacterium]|nr:VOC family protein [Chromatiales bacterium]
MKNTIVALMLLAWAALSGQPSLAVADELLPLDAQRAHLYLMRPVIGANELSVVVTVNGERVPSLDVNKYLVISLPPGNHQLELEAADASVKKALSIAGGQAAYIFVEMESTAMDYALGIQELARDIAGRYLIRSDSEAPVPLVLDAAGAPLEATVPVQAVTPEAVAPVVAATAVVAPQAEGSGLPSGISIVTLGVESLERSVRFYTDSLGLSLSSHSTRDIAFFELSGSWLALYSRAELANDIGIAAGQSGGFSGFTLAHNVQDKQSVDRVMKMAAEAGAEIVKPAAEAFWGGYSGYFKDPDGFFWEVAWNPHLPLGR